MINDLKEKVDEKDIEISNLQHSKTSAKFTSETQTSLADELNEVAQLKITNEKKALLEKFSEVQTKINLQINVLTKSVQSLKSKSPERCAYGWKCKRNFVSIVMNIFTHIRSFQAQNVMKHLQPQNMLGNTNKIYMKIFKIYQ